MEEARSRPVGDLSVRGVTYIVVCIRTLLFSKQVMGGQTFSFRPYLSC